MHPWFRPLYRRVLTVAACLVWLGVEAYHEPWSLWFWLVFGATVYAVVHLFFNRAADDPAAGKG